MNKKFAIALLLPLMMIPLVSFAYAHFYAYVYKRYAIHVGSVSVEVIYFHIDELKMIDVNNNGVIIGDEFTYLVHYDPVTDIWYVDMIADPIPSGFVLDTTLKIHISGKLPVRLNYAETPAGGQWAGPFDAFPAGLWDNTSITWQPISTLPGVGVGNERLGPWSYDMKVYKQNATGTYGPVGSTQEEYKPSNNVTIVQHVDYRQPDPLDLYPPKLWQCKKILIRWYFQFIEETPQILSSETWLNPNYPPP